MTGEGVALEVWYNPSGVDEPGVVESALTPESDTVSAILIAARRGIAAPRDSDRPLSVGIWSRHFWC